MVADMPPVRLMGSLTLSNLDPLPWEAKSSGDAQRMRAPSLVFLGLYVRTLGDLLGHKACAVRLREPVQVGLGLRTLVLGAASLLRKRIGPPKRPDCAESSIR